MKPINFNKKIIIEETNDSIRPYSVHTFNQKNNYSFLSPLNKNINYSYFNNNIGNNYTNYNSTKNQINSIQEKIPNKKTEIMYKNTLPQNKKKYDNFSVKIYNLYNIKDKNEPFSIKINNSNPKYYINNCVNQLLLKKLNTDNSPQNIESQLSERNIINKNNNNLLLSLISPKFKTYKKIILNNKTNENIINSKKYNENNLLIKNNQNNKKKYKKCLIMNNYNNFNYSDMKQKGYKKNFNYGLNLKETYFEEMNDSQIGKFDDYFKTKYGNKTLKNVEIKTIMNKYKNSKNNKVLKPNLTLENQTLIPNNFRNIPKIKNIKNNQTISFLNMKYTKQVNKNVHSNVKNQVKQKKTNINNKKPLNFLFDLKNNIFESETINQIIKEFNDNEEEEPSKSKEIDKDSTQINKKITNKIKDIKINFKKRINDKILNNTKTNLKKIKDDDFDIYLQYNQNKQVEKIILNDKYGNKTTFIPLIEKNSKYNSIENTNK